MFQHGGLDRAQALAFGTRADSSDHGPHPVAQFQVGILQFQGLGLRTLQHIPAPGIAGGQRGQCRRRLRQVRRPLLQGIGQRGKRGKIVAFIAIAQRRALEHQVQRADRQLHLFLRELVGRVQRWQHHIAERLDDGLDLEFGTQVHQSTSSSCTRSSSSRVYEMPASQATSTSWWVLPLRGAR